MWLKRIFGGKDVLPELSEADVDALISWSHRQLMIHDALLPRFCKRVFEDIAAWVAIPPMVAMRCLGFTDTPDEKTLNRLEAGIGELSVVYGLGDRAKDDELADVGVTLRQHTKLFIVFWLKAFSKVKPKSYFKSQPTLSKMLMALLENPEQDLQEHLGLDDPDDRYDFAEAVAQLIKQCYTAVPELEAAVARDGAPTDPESAADGPTVPNGDDPAPEPAPKGTRDH